MPFVDIAGDEKTGVGLYAPGPTDAGRFPLLFDRSNTPNAWPGVRFRCEVLGEYAPGPGTESCFIFLRVLVPIIPPY